MQIKKSSLMAKLKSMADALCIVMEKPTIIHFTLRILARVSINVLQIVAWILRRIKKSGFWIWVRLLGQIRQIAGYLFRRLLPKRFQRRNAQSPTTLLPPFHPQTVIRDFGDGDSLRIEDALTGILVLGQTGSGKSSSIGRSILYGYCAAGFGMLICCSKIEERQQIEKIATDCGRLKDVIVVGVDGEKSFNVLQWEAGHGRGGGIVMNIVALLEEVAIALSKTPGQTRPSGNDTFWRDSLHHFLIHLVSIPVFLQIEISLPFLKELLDSAPRNPEQVRNPKWQESSSLWKALEEAQTISATAPDQMRSDFAHCIKFWTKDYPALNEKTRSIIDLTFNTLAHPLITGPLCKLFCGNTEIRPEMLFDGSIIIVDLPVQELRMLGRIANIIWKFCTQLAISRRILPTTPDTYLRPVAIFADEVQFVLSEYDTMFQTTARSAGGATVFLSQSRENFRLVMGNNDAVDSLLANLATKCFCKNTGETTTWASDLIGKRWVNISSTNFGNKNQGQSQQSLGVNMAEQYRYYVEPTTFATLKHGGAENDFQVEMIVFKAGHLFRNPVSSDEEFLPYKLLTLNQK